MKIIKKTVLLSIILSTFFMCGCMSYEDKEQVKEYEKEAKEYLKEYLEDNYSSAKILDVEHEVRGNGIEGFYISDLTRCEVRIESQKYLFFYDVNTKDIYSNVNYKQICDDVNNTIVNSADKLPSNDFDILSKIYYCGYEVVKDTDTTLSDVLASATDNESDYIFDVSITYPAGNSFTPKDIEIESCYETFPQLNLSIYSLSNYNIKDLNFAKYTDILRYQNSTNYDTNEEFIFCTYTHNCIEEFEDIICIYNDHYIDFEISDDGKYYDNPPRKYYPNVKFKPTKKAYRFTATITSDTAKKEYTLYNSSNFKTKVKEEDATAIKIYFPENSYKSNYVHHENDKLTALTFSKDYDYIRWFVNDTYFEENISFYIEVD